MPDQLSMAIDQCKERGCPHPVVGSSTTGKGRVCKGHNESEWGRALRSYDPALSAALGAASRRSTHFRAKRERRELMKLNSKIKVTRVIPGTGEIVEEVVGKSRFKKKSDWAILPTDARNEILSGEKPALLWDGNQPCPVMTMQEIKLSSSVALEIWRITKAHAGDHLVEPKDYIVKDLRGRMPRRSLPVSAAEEQLERPTKDVLDKARLDGSYTSSRSQSVPGTDDEVPEDYLTLLAGEGLYRSGQLRVDRRGSEGVRRLEAKRDEAVRLGKPGRAIYLESKIAKSRPQEGG